MENKLQNKGSSEKDLKMLGDDMFVNPDDLQDPIVEEIETVSVDGTGLDLMDELSGNSTETKEDKKSDEVMEDKGDLEGEKKGDTSKDLGEDKDSFNLEELLSSLDATEDVVEDKKEDVAGATEDLGKVVSEIGNSELQKRYDEMIARNTEFEMENMKLKKTLDILRGNYESMLNSNLEREMSGGAERKVMEIIDGNPRLKNILALELKTLKSGVTDEVIEGYRNILQELTGMDFSELIDEANQKRKKAASGSPSDSSNNILIEESEDDMFV